MIFSTQQSQPQKIKNKKNKKDCKSTKEEFVFDSNYAKLHAYMLGNM
jgi:hypothetical protein